MKKKRMQTIKVTDYGDDWINRLAVVMMTFSRMGDDEREATLRYLLSKYQQKSDK